MTRAICSICPTTTASLCREAQPTPEPKLASPALIASMALQRHHRRTRASRRASARRAATRSPRRRRSARPWTDACIASGRRSRPPSTPSSSSSRPRARAPPGPPLRMTCPRSPPPGSTRRGTGSPPGEPQGDGQGAGGSKRRPRARRHGRNAAGLPPLHVRRLGAQVQGRLRRTVQVPSNFTDSEDESSNAARRVPV